MKIVHLSRNLIHSVDVALCFSEKSFSISKIRKAGKQQMHTWGMLRITNWFTSPAYMYISVIPFYNITLSLRTHCYLIAVELGINHLLLFGSRRKSNIHNGRRDANNIAILEQAWDYPPCAPRYREGKSGEYPQNILGGVKNC